MKEKLTGRHYEKRVLKEALQSPAAELVAVTGRRRVGKTYLVRSVYEGPLKFVMTGIQNASMHDQLQHLANSLNLQFKPDVPFKKADNWLNAFHELSLYLEKKAFKKKYVLFFDELPWMATHRSDFVKAFGAFWNSWAAQQNIVIVICGSAVSWIVQKIIRDKGGLHNRITKRIRLEPFTLTETRAYLQSRSMRFDHYQLVQFYMAMGGIPHYLKEIVKGGSVAQNLDRICFSPNGILRDEFDLLYPALFERPENHIKIVRLLGKRWQGLTRKEIIEFGKFSNGGTISKSIEELIHSGFIQSYYTFGKNKRGLRYRLIDEYTIFYLKFIERKRLEEKGMWIKFNQSQTYKTWAGYAFESLCLRHIPQIKKALGIQGVYSETSVYRSTKTDEVEGTQIDIVIDRNDQIINLLELKFYNTEFLVTSAFAKSLRKKKAIFKHNTKTKKQLSWVLLSTFGHLVNEHSQSILDRSLNMDVLFEEVN